MADDADDIKVTIHGRYGRGPMPVEFRDAMAEMIRLVRQGVDDGTIGHDASRKPAGAPLRDDSCDAGA